VLSQFKIFFKISFVVFSERTLALFSPLLRTQTRSRLSQIFLYSFAFNQSSVLAFKKGNQLFLSKKSIKSSFSVTPSISVSFGFQIFIEKRKFTILKKAVKNTSKKAKRFTQTTAPTNIRF
jgi:hypothetical protein